MKRYELTELFRRGYGIDPMVENENGEWVKYKNVSIESILLLERRCRDLEDRNAVLEAKHEDVENVIATGNIWVLGKGMNYRKTTIKQLVEENETLKQDPVCNCAEKLKKVGMHSWICPAHGYKRI